jgi:hypothetical protein
VKIILDILNVVCYSGGTQQTNYRKELKMITLTLENVDKMQVFVSQLQAGVTGYSLPDRTLTLKSGEIVKMNTLAYDVIQLALKNVELSHQKLILDMVVAVLADTIGGIMPSAASEQAN